MCTSVRRSARVFGLCMHVSMHTYKRQFCCWKTTKERSERILQTEREVTYRNELAEDEILWRYFVDTVINVGMHGSRELPDSMRTY